MNVQCAFYSNFEKRFISFCLRNKSHYCKMIVSSEENYTNAFKNKTFDFYSRELLIFVIKMFFSPGFVISLLEF